MTDAERMTRAPRIVDRLGARRRTLQRWAALVTAVAGVVVGLVAGTFGAGAAAPTPAPQVAPALDWLAAQMAANGGTIPGFTPGSTDWGVTADAILAFAAAGRTDDPAATWATDRLAEGAAEFTTWTVGADTVRDAGSTGKAVLALLSMGRPPVAGGVDLEAELRSLVVPSGPYAGRVADRVPDPSWDVANGFAQSLSILALAMTDGGVPERSIGYLLLQQCPAGGFRLDLSGTVGCEDDARADNDATALALQALLAVDRTPAVAAALEKGTVWLLGRQNPDGSYGGAGPTAPPNANSAGLVAQYLRSAGFAEAADRAAEWVAACCQLTSAIASGTPATPHVGAIGYNAAARDTALANGISPGAADQWRRTTSQAVLAFGLAPYGPQDVAPLPPLSTTTTSPAPSSSSTSVPDASTSSTTPGPDPTTPAPPPPVGPSQPVTVDGPDATVADAGLDTGGSDGAASSGSGRRSTGARTTSGSSGRLASTGGDPVLLLGAAVTLLAVGGALAVAGRRSPW
jgi:hypothetical protein